MNYHTVSPDTHTHTYISSRSLSLSLSLSLSHTHTYIQVLDHARQLETQNQGLTRTVEELHTRVADLETALAASNAETVAAALRAVGATSLGTADSGTGGRAGKKRVSKIVPSIRGGVGPPPPPVIGGGPPPPPAIGGGPPPPPMMGGGPGGPPPPPPGPPGPPGAPPRLGGGRGVGGGGLLPAGVALPAKVNPAVPLRALFWNKLPNNKLMGTVWVDWHVAESKGRGGGEGVAFDLRKLEASFAKKVSGQDSKARTPAGTNEGAGAGGKPRKAVSLLDGKRQQNGGITMARLRLDGAALRAALVAVNLEVLTVDKVKAVGQLVPTAEEAHTLAEHDASNPATVPPLDALMLTLSEFPRLKPRLDAMTFRHNFAEKCGEIAASIGSLGKAVDAVRGSTAIKTVLMTVLHVGNHMNGGTNRGQCIGFKVRLYTLSVSLRGLCQGGLPSSTLARKVRGGDGCCEGRHRSRGEWLQCEVGRLRKQVTPLSQLGAGHSSRHGPPRPATTIHPLHDMSVYPSAPPF